MPISGAVSGACVRGFRKVVDSLVLLSSSGIIWHQLKTGKVQTGYKRGVVCCPCHRVLSHCWLKTMTWQCSVEETAMMIASHTHTNNNNLPILRPWE